MGDSTVTRHRSNDPAEANLEEERRRREIREQVAVEVRELARAWGVGERRRSEGTQALREGERPRHKGGEQEHACAVEREAVRTSETVEAPQERLHPGSEGLTDLAAPEVPHSDPTRRRALEELLKQGRPVTWANLVRMMGHEGIPEAKRRFLSALSGEQLLDGSVLGDWVSAGELSENTVEILLAGHTLQAVGRSPVDLSRDLEGVRWGIRALTGQREVLAQITREGVDQSSEPLPSLRMVERWLLEVEEAVGQAERLLRQAGYAWRDGAIVRPNGANPRALYRDVVDALLQSRGPKVRGTREVREWIASELAPLPFPAELRDPGRGKLKATVDNLLRRK